MRKPKHTIEVLPSKEDLALDRLANAVLQRIADKEADRPETDEELSESVLMQPWCLPRNISQAIRRLIPVWHSEKHALVYEEHGCFKCERKDVPHQSLGLCMRCFALYTTRLKAAIVKRANETTGGPNLAEKKAALTLKADSARNILAEIVAGGTCIVAKPTKTSWPAELGQRPRDRQVMVAWAFSPANCPRCDGALRERGPNRKWRRFFECGQCWTTFEPVIERRFQPCGHNPRAKFMRHTITLQPGRSRCGRSK